MSSRNMNRRQFAVAAAGAVSIPNFLLGEQSNSRDEPVSFYLVGNAHFF